MLFDTKIEYTVIEDVPISVIEKVLRENNVYLTTDTLSNRWAAFAHYYGLRNNLHPVICGSFASMISQFITGTGWNCGTDKYLKESRIEKDLIKIYNNIAGVQASEEKKVKLIFESFFKYYVELPNKYWIKTERVALRLTIPEYSLFNSIAGSDVPEKFFNLLKFYNEYHR